MITDTVADPGQFWVLLTKFSVWKPMFCLENMVHPSLSYGSATLAVILRTDASMQVFLTTCTKQHLGNNLSIPDQGNPMEYLPSLGTQFALSYHFTNLPRP